MSKSASSIDAHVGSRVRLRRMLLNMSQEKLAEQLSLTFQQVQKYEKGSNRISAGRLLSIAKILSVPIQFFYDDMPRQDKDYGAVLGMNEESEEFVMDFVNSSEGLQLNQAFNRIKDLETRKRIVELVKTLAETSEIDALKDPPEN